MYKKHTLKTGKKSRKTRFLKKKQTRKFRKYTRKLNNKKLVGGDVDKFELWINSLNAIPDELFLNLNISDTDNADQILDNLKKVLNKEILYEILERNRNAINGQAQKNLLPNKFSCSNVREIYKKLIKVFGSSWEDLLNKNGQNNNNKAKALGLSWIRWVLRVTSRLYTDENIGYLTRKAIKAAALAGIDVDCGVKYLQERDQRVYGQLKGEVMEGECQNENEQCPSVNYIIKKYDIINQSDDSPDWIAVINSAQRSNAAVDRTAGVSK